MEIACDAYWLLNVAVLSFAQIECRLDSLNRNMLHVARDLGKVLLAAGSAHTEARSASQYAYSAKEAALESRREAGAAREAALTACSEAVNGRQAAEATYEALRHIQSLPQPNFENYHMLPREDVSLSFSSSAMEDEPEPGTMSEAVSRESFTDGSSTLQTILEDESAQALRHHKETAHLSSHGPRSVLSHAMSSGVRWEEDLRRQLHESGRVSSFLSHVRRFDFAVQCLASESDAQPVSQSALLLTFGLPNLWFAILLCCLQQNHLFCVV